jgi:hypothetical protein
MADYTTAQVSQLLGSMRSEVAALKTTGAQVGTQRCGSREGALT